MEKQQNATNMNKCSVCSNNFEDKYFDAEQNKCILHCDKDENNGWYTLDENNTKTWNESKVNIFWHYIQTDLDRSYQNYIIDIDLTAQEYILFNVIFPKFQDEVEYFSLANNEDEMGTNFYSYDIFEHPNQQPMPEVNTFFTKLIVSFNGCTFLDDANFEKYGFEHPILFDECIFENGIQLNKIYKNRVSFLTCTLDNLNCEDIVFEQKVKIQYCTVTKKANFYNTKFKELADFYQTKFNEVVFIRTDFEQIAVFSETEFKEDVDFKYTKFLGKSIFRDTVIKGKLNLRDTIFDDEANFLDITSENRKDEKGKFQGEPKVIEVANRETARIIKNFYDKSNNIIEANKFYALEMQERRKEINFRSNFFEWVVFFFHGLSSNHSQSWGLTLYWMFILSMLYTSEINGIRLMTLFVGFVTIAILTEHYFKKYTLFIKYSENLFALLFAILISVYVYFNFETWLKLVSTGFINKIVKNMYIFSNFNSENITLGFLLYKAILSYLMYQFIVSVRQNTRRK